MRGLNCRAKRTAVRSVISSANPCIVCLSKTKLNSVSSLLVLETLGAPSADFFFLPATGTRGGILLAWRCDRISLANPIIGTFHVSATVSLGASTTPWWITSVYGPQGMDEKLAFMAELHDLRDMITGRWLLGGDFNVITSCADKNNGNLNPRTMNRFRRFIADHALRDIYLHSRRYTWSNEQSNPTLVRNDRVLCTPSWATINPHHMLRCLATAVSDHCPLVVNCASRNLGKRRFHFERLWPKLDGFLTTVDEAWNSIPPDPDPFRRINSRLKITARRLQSWGRARRATSPFSFKLCAKSSTASTWRKIHV
ncbi:uncharacterized protein [Aegilops tauschii subsp. strangulata]|uniref:uncharacterized protein n=1 Tax=Aegilops tauschii subsp. strangulata TaxID=200361 RepID=UPI003CC893B3